MDHSPEEPSLPHCSPGEMLSTPESPPMSNSMVEREARSILLRLEALVATPLVDTRPISLVDFTLSSSDYDTSPDSKTMSQRHRSSTSRRCLFGSPGSDDAPEMMEDVLKLVDEELEGFSLRASSPLPSCSRPPVNETSFNIDAEELGAHDVVATSTPCPSPSLGDTTADDPKKSRNREFVPEVSASGSGDAASSDAPAFDEQEALCRLEEGVIQSVDDSTPPKSSASPTINNGVFVLAEDGSVGGNDIGHASLEDRKSCGSPAPSLPALNKTFVIAGNCSPTVDRDGQDRCPPTEVSTSATVAAPTGSAKQKPLPTRGKPLLHSKISLPRAAPLQQPAAQISVTMKYRAAPKRPSAAGGQPKDIQVRSGVTASAAARTTIRKCTQVYRRPSLASKVVEQQKTVPRSEAPKAGRKTLAPLTVAKPPTARPTPNLPEPRKPMGPPAKATTALKSLLPAKGATGSAAQGSAAKLQTASGRVAPLPAFPGSKRFSCVLPRTTYVESKPVAAPKKGNSGMSAGSSLQSTRLPPTRLRPASVSQVSRNPTREPRLTFGKVPGAPSKCASSEVDKL